MRELVVGKKLTKAQEKQWTVPDVGQVNHRGDGKDDHWTWPHRAYTLYRQVAGERQKAAVWCEACGVFVLLLDDGK